MPQPVWNGRRLADGRLEPAGTRRIESNPLDNAVLAPPPLSWRTCTMYKHAALCVSMAHWIPTYMRSWIFAS